jgi:hypothetical protein
MSTLPLSRKTIEASLIVSFAVLTVVFAGLAEAKNDTTSSDDIIDDRQILYKGSKSSK